MGEAQFDAARLQDLMDRRGVSDYTLAELAGMSHTMIYYLRKGKRTAPSAEIVAKLAAALETTTGYLMGEPSGGQVTVVVPETVRQLTEIANRLSMLRQEELVRMAAALEEMEKEMPVADFDGQMMELLLQAVEKLRAAGEEGDPLPSLERLARLAQNRTLLLTGTPRERLGNPS